MKKRQKFANMKLKPVIYAFILTLSLLFFGLDWSQAATPNTAKHYTELELPPLPEVKLPTYEKFRLKNGMTVYLLPDRELPLITGTAMIRTGERLEPGDRTGLAKLVGTVMRTGGTKKHSGDELNQLLEQRAASVETSMNESMGTASFQSLTEDVDTVLGLFAEVLREPVFAPEKLELAKTQEKGQITRRNDNPDAIARREFRKLIYGENSPYARTTEIATIDKISRDDLIKFYQQYYYPNNMILGVTGDFEPAKMKNLIQAKFADWQPTSRPIKPQLPSVSQAKSGGVFFVDQPQLTQSNILIGHLGGQFNSPDYPALDVMSSVLNGFGGRLFNELRSRQGLAYSVYGVWSPRHDYPGLFIAGGQTRSDATVQFIQALKAEIKRLQTEPVSDRELKLAKESTLNSFVFNFENPQQILTRIMRYAYFGYPEDFLFRYREKVETTTAADIQTVAKKYLKPDNLVTLVVGNQTAIKPPLTQIANQVTPIDVTIPGMKPPTS